MSSACRRRIGTADVPSQRQFEGLHEKVAMFLVEMVCPPERQIRGLPPANSVGWLLHAASEECLRVMGESSSQTKLARPSKIRSVHRAAVVNMLNVVALDRRIGVNQRA